MSDRTKVTLPSLHAKVAAGTPITWLTCYDYPTAVMQDQAGVDMILVGDSLGMTMLGFDSTLPVTMDDMIRHTAAVRRGAPNAWVIGDMPYMSYQPSVETAIRNAGRFMAETGCDAVKLEGGSEMADRLAGIARAGIPVMGHLGLTPQSASSLGGFRVQGRGAAQASKIVDDARILEEAGAFSIILELVPDRLCGLITRRAQSAIIMGLGSGPDAHGQLLIYHDAFGLYPRFKPRMAKVFADAGALIREGLAAYVAEVTERTFPQPENWFGMKDEEYEELLRGLDASAGRGTRQVPDRFAARMQQVKPNAIGDLLRHGADPNVISFAGGYPNPDQFPVEELRAVFHQLLTEESSVALQYTVSNGLHSLRQHVAARMVRDGVACTADDVLILQGGQQGLDLVGKLVLDPGDTVVTENPTFLGAMIAFDPCQPTYAPVRTDEGGLDVEDLERVLARSPRAKLLYTVPEFQNPMGVTLGLERRKRLIELAKRYDLLVLEDTPYRHLRYDGEDVSTLKSLDTEGRVIYLGSFSKILAPGMRLGWVVAGPEILFRLGLLKLAADTQCSTLNMSAASAYMDQFDLDAHIVRINIAYRKKRDLMLQTLERVMPAGVTFTRPIGGLFTWLTFPEGFDAAAFMRDEALPKAKVAYVPGGTFFPVVQEPNHARVNFSGASDDNIVLGVGRLGELLRATLRLGR